MAADSKEIGFPFIFNSSEDIDFTTPKAKDAKLAIRRAKYPEGALTVEVRGRSKIRIAFIRGRWLDIHGHTLNKDELNELLPETPPHWEVQAKQVCQLFHFLREEIPDWKSLLMHILLPSDKEAITLPQFQHFKYDLSQAIQNNNLTHITWLLEAKASLNKMQMGMVYSPDQVKLESIPPLSLAISKGFNDIASYLIDKGASLTGHSSLEKEWSAFGEAIDKHNVDLIELLIKLKVDPNLKGANTPLQRACKLHDPDFDTVKALLQAKADPNLVGSELSDPPVLLAINTKRLWVRHAVTCLIIIEELIAAKANLDARSSDGETLLHKAVRINEPDLIQSLLGKKVPILRSLEGLTPFELARKLLVDNPTSMYRGIISELLGTAEPRQCGLAFLAGTHKRQAPPPSDTGEKAVDRPLYRATGRGLFDRQVLRIILDSSGVKTTKRKDVPSKSPAPS